MNYLSQILFFFGAIGAFNSFFLAFYLLVNKSYAKRENRVFGFFLLILSLRVLKSLFYAFSSEEPIWFLQSGPSFFLLIGPLLFSYTTHVINTNSFWSKYWKKHLLFWLLIIVLLSFLIPFKNNIQLHKTVILPIINLQWLVFILLSGIIIKLNYKNIIQLKWLSFLIGAVFTIWAFYTFIPFDYFISSAIIFSILFYIFFLFFLLNKKTTSKVFEKIKLKKSTFNSEEDNLKIKELHTIMKEQKLYVKSNLKLSEVAKKLHITTHQLSKLLNDNLDKNFTDFINEYRINEAKQLMQDNSKYTIEAIGNQSGFNSKSAFYKAFKKFNGVTPAKYQSQL